MQNFQNELQSLEMDQYRVGELTPIQYQPPVPVQFNNMRRCGGCGGCGRCGGCGGCARCAGCFGCFGCFGFFI